MQTCGQQHLEVLWIHMNFPKRVDIKENKPFKTFFTLCKVVSQCVEGAVCGGAVWWSWGSIIAQLPGNWEGTGRPSPTLFPVFHVLSPPFTFLSIPCAVLSPYSSLKWDITEGCGHWAPETGFSRQEPAVILNLLDRFLEQEWRHWAPSSGHSW